MAFRFGFADGDDDDINPSEHHEAFPTPSTSESQLPGVKEHPVKDLVGRDGFPYCTTQDRRRRTDVPQHIPVTISCDAHILPHFLHVHFSPR